MDPHQATEALLAVIEEDRLRQCDAIEAEARRAAAQILGEARAAARVRVREALAVERRRLRDGLAAIDAALATEVRLHDQRGFRALLEKTWERLPAALAARWSDAMQRGEWVRHIVEAARAALPAGEWTLAHGPGWPLPEREALAEQLERQGIEARFVEQAAFGPGLEVRCKGNRVDGTAAGLTADAGEVGARLLDCLAMGDAASPLAAGMAAAGSATGMRP
jgi:hypothetical protein